mmetsp:Transcript_4803/g.6833  ORF Transcript_4803/g.6833 Transcript_4803/m.6833 type:complete len:377 (-) Transcript_4803:402-1532(-)
MPRAGGVGSVRPAAKAAKYATLVLMVIGGFVLLADQRGNLETPQSSIEKPQNRRILGRGGLSNRFLRTTGERLGKKDPKSDILRLRGGILGVPDEFFKPWLAFDEEGNMNGPPENRRQGKHKNWRRQNMVTPVRYEKCVWYDPLVTPWGYELSPNPSPLPKPHYNWLKNYDMMRQGLPPVYYRWAFFERLKSDYQINTYSKKPKRKKRWRKIHQFWKRVFHALFDDEPGNVLRTDADVQVSGIDREDKMGKCVNWTFIYSKWPDQEEIEDNMELELDQYEAYLPRNFLWKTFQWTFWIFTIYIYHKRHPYRNVNQKYNKNSIGMLLEPEQQAQAYKDGLLGINDLDFRRIDPMAFHNPRFDEIENPIEDQASESMY